MSELKRQLRLILPSLAKEANANQDKEIKRHLYLIKAVCASEKSVAQACEKRGVSVDQFYLWGGRLLAAKNLLCLACLSRKPKRSPKQTKQRIERKISALRRAEPSHGPERISFDLMKLFKIKCQPSTVYNVLKRLKLISPAHAKRLTKRHHKRYRRPLPGYMQIDIKYVPYRINGVQYYEFNAVDHCTTWRLIRLYRNINYYNMLHFLNLLRSRVTFVIFEIQTDNGLENTDKYRNGNLEPTGKHPFDVWCKQNDIVHRLIPIGQKELNGKVENTHKQDDREFYAKDEAKSFESLERQMKSYNERWNVLRATKALDWKTPEQCVSEAYVRAAAYLLCLKRMLPESQPTAPSPEPRKPTKVKPPNQTARYLQWQDWDDKKSQKAFFPLPVISQIFSLLFVGGLAAAAGS